MKKIKIAALLLTAAMAAVPFTSCKHNSTISSDSATPTYSASSVQRTSHAAAINEDTEANSTDFTLNSVIEYQPENVDQKYIYLDVTIKNTSDHDYEQMSSLNNFTILLPDGKEQTSSLSVYYASPFDDIFDMSFNVPAGGEVTGIVHGFAVDKSLNEFTVMFYPTGNEPENKTDVVCVKVTADDIISFDDYKK